ncbi:MAG: phosphoribosylglycinamide formyltransferase [Erysipelotrichaceae bacterium]
MVNIAVFVSGGGSNLQSLIDDKQIKDNIKLVVSNKEAAYGLVRAKDNNIATLVSKDFGEILDVLKGYSIDLVVLAGYLAIIPQHFVDAYPNKIINIHPALLPSFGGKGYYGMNVHKAVYEQGCKVSGPTVHFVTGGVDKGPIILQRSVDISSCGSPEEIQTKVLVLEHQLLPEAVKLYCNHKLRIENNRVEII